MIGENFLANFWAACIVISLMIYLILDGFDLGVGALFGATSNEQFKGKMLEAIAPVWDGNETWLIIAGASLYGAFPSVYAIVLPALYLPVGLMLIALILRGVMFEFRYKMVRGRSFLDLAFSLASITISFVLGAGLGAVVQEIPIAGSQYAGSTFHWLTPFTITCGLGMVVGHALLGAGWLVLKTRGDLRDWAYSRLSVFVALTLAAFFVVQVMSALRQGVVFETLTGNPYGAGFLVLVCGALALVHYGTKMRLDWMPFSFSCIVFVLACLINGLVFWPYILPFSISVADAAAPEISLKFMFYGAGLVAIPLSLAYTLAVFWIFRGKISDDTEFDYER
jgi:cytochrome d ubiquinol oxidase subunit II